MVQTAGYKVCPVKLHFMGFAVCLDKWHFKKKKGEDGVKKYMDGTLQSHTYATVLTAQPLGAECKWRHGAPPLLCAQA